MCMYACMYVLDSSTKGLGKEHDNKLLRVLACDRCLCMCAIHVFMHVRMHAPDSSSHGIGR